MSEINRKLSEAEKALDRAVLTGMNQFLGDFLERVFERGKAADGSQIGEYSTRPFRLKESDVKGFAGLVGVSRLGGKRFFEGGTEELRSDLGLESDFVNLNFTGSLFSSVKIGQIKGKPAVGIVGSEEVSKAKENEARFKKIIFSASKQELAAMRKAIFKSLKRDLK